MSEAQGWRTYHVGGEMPPALAWLEITTRDAEPDAVELGFASPAADTTHARREALERLVADNPWASAVRRGKRSRDDLPGGPDGVRSWVRGNVRIDGTVDWETKPITQVPPSQESAEFDRAIAVIGLAALRELDRLQ